MEKHYWQPTNTMLAEIPKAQNAYVCRLLLFLSLRCVGEARGIKCSGQGGTEAKLQKDAGRSVLHAVFHELTGAFVFMLNQTQKHTHHSLDELNKKLKIIEELLRVLEAIRPIFKEKDFDKFVSEGIQPILSSLQRYG